MRCLALTLLVAWRDWALKIDRPSVVRFGFTYMDKHYTAYIGRSCRKDDAAQVGVFSHAAATMLVEQINNKPFTSQPPDVQIHGVHLARHLAFHRLGKKCVAGLEKSVIEDMAIWSEVVPVTPSQFAEIQAEHEIKLRMRDAMDDKLNTYLMRRQNLNFYALAGGLLVIALLFLTLITQ
jgi:hypothetical protein